MSVSASERPADSSFTRPDYAGRGIANLMVSLEQALGRPGGGDGLTPCDALPADLLRDARHVVLLVIDGMGARQLEAHAPHGALSRARTADLTSVFPSTTASAVSTFLTGDAPLAHGLTGWHMWFRELGIVAAPLPFNARGTHRPLQDLGVSAPGLLRTRAFTQRLARRAEMLHPANLCDTEYTAAHTGGATVRPFAGLAEMTALVTRLARERDPSYCYAYWPVLDSLSHRHGWASRTAGEHLREVDRAVEACARALAGTGTVLLVCADHGFVDTRADTRLRLEDHPRIAATLEHPLCGEPRLAYCYVKPQARAEFEERVAEALGHAVDVWPAERVFAEGLLGPGPAHPEIRHRVGTHVLSLRGEYCLTDRLPGEEPFTLVGVHGGMSDAELRVPLSVFGP